MLFLSERMVVGVGFDCNPMVFVADESGLWYVEYLELARLASFTCLNYFLFSFFFFFPGGGGVCFSASIDNCLEWCDSLLFL